MPLRDHFHPPLVNRRHWEGIHSAWINAMVRRLSEQLPPGYFAEPQVHLGTFLEPDAHEVRVLDEARDVRLVAVVEVVSPRNKHRPESRHKFAIKVANYLREQIGIVLVDVVGSWPANLYAETLRHLGLTGRPPGAEPSPLYAVACRTSRPEAARQLEVWPHALTFGAPLPTLPLWLASDLAVPLDLEASYEETCRILRIA